MGEPRRTYVYDGRENFDDVPKEYATGHYMGSGDPFEFRIIPGTHLPFLECQHQFVGDAEMYPKASVVLRVDPDTVHLRRERGDFTNPLCWIGIQRHDDETCKEKGHPLMGINLQLPEVRALIGVLEEWATIAELDKSTPAPPQRET